MSFMHVDATDGVKSKEETQHQINFKSRTGRRSMEPTLKKKLIKGGIAIFILVLIDHQVRVNMSPVLRRNVFRQVITRKWKARQSGIIHILTTSIFEGNINKDANKTVSSISANNLLQSMDRRIDPCEDFYNFTCGNWKKQHPIPDTSFMNSWLHEITHFNTRKIRDFLRSGNTEDNEEPIPWKKAKMMYRSCMDENKLQSLGIEPVVKMLKEIGLRGPSKLWSNSSKPTSKWYTVAAKAKKILSLELLIGLKIQPFFISGENRIILSPPQESEFLPGFLKMDQFWKLGYFNFLEEQNQQTNSSMPDLKQIEIGYRLMHHMSTILGQMFNQSTANTLGIARKILMLEAEIANLTEIDDKTVIQISLDDFQKYTDSNSTGSTFSQIDWREYFHTLFENVNVSISGKDKIIVAKPDYFKTLISIISNSTREDLDMMIYWKVVNSVAGHLTADIRRSKENWVKFITGIEAKEASNIIKKKPVTEVFNNVRKAFMSIVKTSEWLDSNTKNMMTEKVEAIQIMTSYSKWKIDRKNVEQYYQQLKLEDGQFLLSAVNISKWKMQKYLTSVSTGLVTEDALNYGSLGFTLGHELHHAFDIRDYSKYGWGPDLKVNGERTADENMPDTGGLQASLVAYQALMGTEPKLPGLEDFTDEQIFFLSFANFFCIDMKEYARKLALQDVHTPNRFRLLGAVTHSKEFSRIWGCQKGAKMNLEDKRCKLW
ncbi:hypothetical protein C0J52_02851 [Blattella germanica]|nr:hypothetical protein C0J52_02851 [Blattella germanica]